MKETLLEALTVTLDRLNRNNVCLQVTPGFPYAVPDPLHLPECADLVQAVEAEPKLKMFDRTLQYVGGSGSQFSRSDVAKWMLIRGSRSTCETAVDDVWRYIHTPEFKAYQVMLLTQLYVDANEEHDLGDGMKVTSIGAAPTECLKHYWGEGLYSPSAGASSCIFKPIKLRRHHTPQVGDQVKSNRVEIPSFESMDDARLLMSLVRRQGVQAIASTIVADDSVPASGANSYSLHSYRAPGSMGPSLIGIESRQTKSLYEQFTKLLEREKTWLRVPLRKFNEHLAESDFAQSVIDLRTCLEALFLNEGGQGELSYRLGLRAALFTEEGEEERAKVKRLIQQAYTICSEAVHTGKVTHKPDKGKTIKAASEVAKRALRKAIDNPKVDWPKIELSGGQ